MFDFLKKYGSTLLLTIVLLVITSCHKGGEPVPYSEKTNVSTKADSINLRFGDADDAGSGGVDGGTIIGGDDNEDDDDGDSTANGSNQGGDGDGVRTGD